MSLKWTEITEWETVLWSDESKFEIVVGNDVCFRHQSIEYQELPNYYMCTVQKLASVMVWDHISACGVDNLHIFETANVKLYIHTLEQRSLQTNVFFMEILDYLGKKCQIRF